MFRSTRVRLTVLYCIIFFGIFWLFSGGLYVWMSQSFGESYISEVTQSQQEQQGNNADTGPDTTAETAAIAGDITLAQLKNVILALNVIFLLLVPILAWILTGRSLRPVRQMYEQQKQFVSDASHELRTPLTIMRGELDLALKRQRTPKEYRSALAATNNEVQRLQQLVNNLLTIARAEGKDTLYPTEPANISQILDRVVRRLRPLTKESEITLKTTQPKTQAITYGIPGMLEQLFENVINNAIKFSPAGSDVAIRCEVQDHRILVSVLDHGPGMSAETVNHIFDRFYRENKARNDDGFGLGLAICQMIVKQHNGNIAIESKLQQGTTVTITLPKST